MSARLQKKVDNWNDLYPVGQAVKVKRDSGLEERTFTRSEAQLLSGHTAVIWLEGIAGCYMLDRISAVKS